jgi:hypothetical protein
MCTTDPNPAAVVVVVVLYIIWSLGSFPHFLSYPLVQFPVGIQLYISFGPASSICIKDPYHSNPLLLAFTVIFPHQLFFFFLFLLNSNITLFCYYLWHTLLTEK